MTTITNVRTIEGDTISLAVETPQDRIIDANGCVAFPAFIDPHVHFRVPGAEQKETWETGARAAIHGGVTTVFDMPNNNPPCTTVARVHEKKKLIESQLQTAGIPLRYRLYLGADSASVDEIQKAKDLIVGIKVYLGSSTGNLLIDSQETFERICEIAARCGIVVAVHAEDESLMQQNVLRYGNADDVSYHSKIRTRDCATVALERALAATKKYGNRLYIVHASTAEEVAMVRAAKKEGINIFLEATPHHLFLNESIYPSLGTRAQMNPPLRTAADNEALWEGIADGTIDTIGTDHAPHTLAEKNQPYGKTPSGVPGIENYLALLVHAARQGILTYDKIVDLTRSNVERIFDVPANNDIVLVDVERSKEIKNSDQFTKCAWSPYAGMTLTGWPAYTILGKNIYPLV
ncbi:dihydroorotase [Candidatus Uhrbacteria bacterium]|nr:dihydroorotase [Candidatus Uhrbacteria bacterium]